MLNGSDRRPLPEALRQRLQEIPRREAVCRDVERLYRATLRRARSASGHDAARRDAAVDRHLESCARCREVYGTLFLALAEARRPLPARLASRLSALARKPETRLPLWIADVRYAAAVCYLVAALALGFAGDASALLRGATDAVGSKAQEWTASGESRGLEAWSTVRSQVGSGVGAGWHHLRRYGHLCERWLSDARRALGDSTRELLPDRDRSVEGENDGTT